MTVRIYGQAPSRSSDPTRPLSGRSGARLAALLDVDVGDLGQLVELRNLMRYYPGPAKAKGDRFDAHDAALSAGYEIARWENLDRIVLLGQKVAASFRVRREFLEEFDWMIVDDGPATLGKVVRCVVLPHPSGVVRWWNEGQNREAAGEILRDFVFGREEAEDASRE